MFASVSKYLYMVFVAFYREEDPTSPHVRYGQKKKKKRVSAINLVELVCISNSLFLVTSSDICHGVSISSVLSHSVEICQPL